MAPKKKLPKKSPRESGGAREGKSRSDRRREERRDRRANRPRRDAARLRFSRRWTAVLICLAITLAGFVLRVAATRNLPPSNQIGSNEYQNEGGYYYDEFLSPVVIYLTTNKIPGKYDDWQTVHPPLLTILGGWFVRMQESVFSLTRPEAFGRLLWIPCIIFLVFAGASYGLFRLVSERAGKNRRASSALLLPIFAVLVFNPRLFIQSLDFGNDLLVNTLILLTLLFGIGHFRTCGKSRFNVRCVGVGVCLGLAALTKYTGLVFAIPVGLYLLITIGRALWTKGEETEERVWRFSPGRGAVLRTLEAAAVVSLFLLIAGWEYANNLRQYDNLMPSNYNRREELKTRLNWDEMKASASKWDYGFDVAGFVRYSREASYDKPMWEQRLYKKLPTSFTALFWDDLGFYSKEGASSYYHYRAKRIPSLVRVLPWLLSLGMLPFFVWGLWVGLRRLDFAGIAVALSGAYLLAFWFYGVLVTGDIVGIKPKYVLALLPIFLAISLRGMESIADAAASHPQLRFFRGACAVYLATLAASAIAYDSFFAFT